MVLLLIADTQNPKYHFACVDIGEHIKMANGYGLNNLQKVQVRRKIKIIN